MNQLDTRKITLLSWLDCYYVLVSGLASDWYAQEFKHIHDTLDLACFCSIYVETGSYYFSELAVTKNMFQSIHTSSSVAENNKNSKYSKVTCLLKTLQY